MTNKQKDKRRCINCYKLFRYSNRNKYKVCTSCYKLFTNNYGKETRIRNVVKAIEKALQSQKQKIIEEIENLPNPYPKDVFLWNNKEKLSFNRGRFNQHCFEIVENIKQELLNSLGQEILNSLGQEILNSINNHQQNLNTELIAGRVSDVKGLGDLGKSNSSPADIQNQLNKETHKIEQSVETPLVTDIQNKGCGKKFKINAPDKAEHGDWCYCHTYYLCPDCKKKNSLGEKDD